MPLLLFVAFVVVPLIEVSAIIQVAEVLRWGPTLVLLLFLSVAGAWLVRREGTAAWRRFRSALASGRPPTTEVVDGALVLIGGTLLLTPGFVTDVLGFWFVFPPTRTVASRIVRRRIRSSFPLMGMFDGPPRGGRRTPRRPGHSGREVVDAEVIEVKRDPHP